MSECYIRDSCCMICDECMARVDGLGAEVERLEVLEEEARSEARREIHDRMVTEKRLKASLAQCQSHGEQLQEAILRDGAVVEAAIEESGRHQQDDLCHCELCCAVRAYDEVGEKAELESLHALDRQEKEGDR